MRVALAVLCIGAVAFLLRVLMALLNEWTNQTSGPVRIYIAKFNPSRRRGQLVEIDAELKERAAARRSARKAV